MQQKFTYSKMFNAREECIRRFGAPFSLPVVSGSPRAMLADTISNIEGRMLDFGAGPQRLKSFINSQAKGLTYHSLDADPQYNCDWANLTEIPPDMFFALICADQVLEHIPIGALVPIFDEFGKKLAPNGFFYATVPNPSHPTRFRGDVDHCTYVTYTDLYYLCTSAGLETISLFRYSKRHPQGWLERLIVKKIQDIYRMDWADSVGVIARKPPRELAPVDE